MKPRPLSEIASAVSGRLVGADVTVDRVVTDSREVSPGSLFVAVRGETADGGDFVGDAFARGAAAVLVDHEREKAGPAVVVGDTLDALLRLAAFDRGPASVVAVTGANGKTSTKDMTASVLGGRYRTHASPNSFNNEIGFPMTMLSAPADTEVIVAEMGARHVGDVAQLCAAVRPDIAVVTNVGVAHLEIFGSWEAIVQASAEPVEALAPQGIAVLNDDDPVVAGYASRTQGEVVLFGLGAGATVRAEDVRLDESGLASFLLDLNGDRERVELPVPGEHMVPNALAAAATASALGMTAAECAAGLKDAQMSHWRMETFTSTEGIIVVNDAYNANPESMSAALKAARWMSRGRRFIAVLGPMAELGEIAAEEHDKLGVLAARIRVDRLITVGEQARGIARAGLREGVEPENVASYDDPAEALADVKRVAEAGDLVLFKASRVAGLEELAEAMR